MYNAADVNMFYVLMSTVSRRQALVAPYWVNDMPRALPAPGDNGDGSPGRSGNAASASNLPRFLANGDDTTWRKYAAQQWALVIAKLAQSPRALSSTEVRPRWMPHGRLPTVVYAALPRERNCGVMCNRWSTSRSRWPPSR